MSPGIPGPRFRGRLLLLLRPGPRPVRRSAAGWATAVLLLFSAVACGTVDVPESLPGPTTTLPTPTPRNVDGADGDDPNCDPLVTVRPDGPAGPDVPEDSYMARIRDRGRLRVGVDLATLQLASVNPVSGEFEGFEIDIVRAVAAALFDEDPDDVDDRVELVGIRSADREKVLMNGRVDLVASAFTITCERRRNIDFSVPYLVTGQRVLVRNDDTDVYEVDDLAGRRVCVSEGSTARRNIKDRAPEAIIRAAPERGDCLVRLQLGLVEALATDDAILAGFAAQDPNLEVRGQPFSDEPYGLGLPADREDWTRYVNAVLEELRASGRWDELYDEWLFESLGDTEPPEPRYGD